MESFQKSGLYDKEHTIHINQNKLDKSSVYTQTTVDFSVYDNYFCIERGFKDLQTVDGELCPTFKAVCVAMNLIENDEMWINCMDEAMNLYSNSNSILMKLHSMMYYLLFSKACK